MSVSELIPLSDFINRCNRIHKGAYNYYFVKRTMLHPQETLPILCDKPGHGVFYVEVFNHTRGLGCPVCKLVKDRPCINDVFNQFHSAGITAEMRRDFPDCRFFNSEVLFFDIYLPDFNLLIDLFGKNHFWNNGIGERIRKKDEVKKKWAEKNKFRYEIVTYTVYEKQDYNALSLIGSG